MEVCTIRDIARLADVSVTTVSRVLNHRPDVKPETRAKVEAVMAEHNFIGNANARSLKQARNEVIPVILRGQNNDFLNSLAQQLLRLTQGSEIPYLPQFIDERANEFETAWQLCRERRIAGLMFVGSKLDDRAKILDGIDLPMVFTTVSAAETTFPRCASVAIDDRCMGRKAIEELLRQGHRKIVVFGTGKHSWDSLAQRFEGVLDAYKDAGLEFQDAYFVETFFSYQGGYNAAISFFAAHPEATAAFCMSDSVSMGVIRALKDLGHRVPEDVSVLGFDGIELGKYLIPRLSTIEQPLELIASESVRAMNALIAGEASPGHIIVDAQLVLRDSVAHVRD